MNGKDQEIVVRALRTTQGDNLDVYALFIRGSDLVRIADISRIARDESNLLKGFQRPEIRSHVKGIVDYLNQGNVLFPNAIILALSPDIKFVAARGSKPTGDEGIAQAGTLRIPLHEEGLRQCHQPKLQPCPRQPPRSSQPPWPSGDDQASAAQSGGLAGLAVM